MLFNNLPKERPFELFHDYYARAEEHGDKFAEAGCISLLIKKTNLTQGL